VHVLGIVHDALSNFHDIARVVEAVHPDVVTLECLPSVVRPNTHCWCTSNNTPANIMLLWVAGSSRGQGSQHVAASA
jgi:hypothetical protein